MSILVLTDFSTFHVGTDYLNGINRVATVAFFALVIEIAALIFACIIRKGQYFSLVELIEGADLL